MLQQTQVATAIPYFENWMARFPNVHALAAASEREVLTLWEGLGYYSRARNLHSAAKLIVAEYNGQLPRDPALLRKLPGIGRYTTAAIASLAFGLDAATLDGNLRRVFARVFDVAAPADVPAGEEILWALAEKHLPQGRAGDYNQALMDLGATICLPRAPLCSLCPVNTLCKARRLGVQEQRPVLKPKGKVPAHIHVAAVIRKEGEVLLARRPSKGLLGGLWEFPNAQIDSASDPARAFPAALESAYALKVIPHAELITVRHAYTHFKLTLHAFSCTLKGKVRGDHLQWIPVSELDHYPMGKADRQIARLIKP
jgi:A/G-specific adenine glycosylase